MSLRTLRYSLSVASFALFSGSAPARAQLPVFVPDTEAAAPVEALPADPEPEAPASAPPASPAPSPSVPTKAPVVGFGQHPYGDDEDDALTGERPRNWYGWQTLILDGASLSALLVGAAIDRSDNGGDGGVVAGFGLLGYEFGAGIVHFVHRNPGRGFASFGMRLGMPLAGAFLGATLSSNCDGYRCEEDGAGAGFLLGMAGAIAIDAAVFAFDDRRPRAARSVVPLASLRPGLAWIGLGGEL